MATMRSKLQRAVLLGVALVAGLLVYSATKLAGRQDPAKGSGDTVTIASAGPVALGADPTEVVLETKDLASRITALSSNRRVYLVLRELRAEAQPDALYHIYLNSPAGSKPEKGSPYDVGAVNFYNAVPLGGGAPAGGQFRSFDVTGLLKNLQQRNAVTDRTTVTIVPSGVPAAAAKASIGRVELVEQ
jgi:hypothetical protein